jgi:hypothetical protein
LEGDSRVERPVSEIEGMVQIPRMDDTRSADPLARRVRSFRRPRFVADENVSIMNAVA